MTIWYDLLRQPPSGGGAPLIQEYRGRDGLAAMLRCEPGRPQQLAAELRFLETWNKWREWDRRANAKGVRDLGAVDKALSAMGNILRARKGWARRGPGDPARPPYISELRMLLEDALNEVGKHLARILHPKCVDPDDGTAADLELLEALAAAGSQRP